MIPPIALLLAAAAYGDLPPRHASSTFPALVRPALMHSDTQPARSALHREAERLATSGKFKEARIAYLAVVASMDSADTFAGEALWALASLEHGRDHELRAAEILDLLSDDAVRYGRPEWQARALLEAGIIYQSHGRTDLSVQRARTLKSLLSSPAISPSARAQIAERVAMK